MAKSKEQVVRPAAMVSDLDVEQLIPPKIINASPSDQRVTAQIRTVCEMLDLSRSEIERRLAAGDIQAVRLGRRTLIVLASVHAFVARLPRAEYRAPADAV